MEQIKLDDDIIRCLRELHAESEKRWDQLLEIAKALAIQLRQHYELYEEDEEIIDDIIDSSEQRGCGDKMPAKKEKASHLRLVE